MKNVFNLLVIVLSMAVVSFGCGNSGSERGTTTDKPIENTTTKTQDQSPTQIQTQTQTQEGGVDKYGRKPGDAHYGHDHAPKADENATQTITPTQQPQQTQPTQEGGPDKFGRMPGDPHYGHNHQ